jgi:hypothetical protein
MGFAVPQPSLDYRPRAARREPNPYGDAARAVVL